MCKYSTASMEIRSELLEKIKCSVCDGYLSYGPVLLLINEDSICGRCRAPESETAIRNLPYEQFAAEFRFPCQYQRHGCNIQRSFIDLKFHEEDCNYRWYNCPVTEFGKCEWSGNKQQLLKHCQRKHSGKIFENPVYMEHNLLMPNQQTFLVVAFNVLFLLHVKVCLSTRKIYHCIRLLQDTRNAIKYNYTLDISDKTGNKLDIIGQVVPQGSLKFEEESSIYVEINKLLDMLDGFDEITFKITLETSISKLFCCYCKKRILNEETYPSAQGWRCKNCVLKKLCVFKEEGCNFIDTHRKTTSHENYFCKYSYIRKECIDCDTSYKGSPLKHATENHSNTILMVDNINTGHIKSKSLNEVFIETEFGTICFAYFNSFSMFEFTVLTPIERGLLYLYKCELVLVNPKTGHTDQKLLDIDCLTGEYDSNYDWFLSIEEEEFIKFVDVNTFNYKLILSKT